MASITLDQIKESIEAKYEPFVVEFGKGQSCTMTQAMMLPRESRRQIAILQEQAGDIDQKADDAEEKLIGLYGDLIREAATDKAEADALIEAIGDTLVTIYTIVEQYGKATQLPEASPSPS